MAERVLAAGKHCFVEKPLAQTVADAERNVAAAAEQAGRILMVGHLLEYHPGLELLNSLARDGELGDIHYIYGNRLNLGKLRAEENALWSLGAHDVSVLLRLAGEEPYEVSASGESYMRQGVEDVVFCFLRFPSGLAAHLHLSWLDPHKERRFTVVGSKKMATFDDMDAGPQAHDLRQGVRPGQHLLRRVHHPLGRHLQPAGAQRRAAAARVPALRRLRARAARTPRSDGASGLRVVKVLEATAAVPGREPPCSVRLTARPACCWARAYSSRGAVQIGGNVVVHAGTVLGHDVRLQDAAVIGKPLALGPQSTATSPTAAARPSWATA